MSLPITIVALCMGRSCLTNLCLYEEVTKMINKGKTVDAFYMDFSKAFDQIPRDGLVQKMKSHNALSKLDAKLA